MTWMLQPVSMDLHEQACHLQGNLVNVCSEAGNVRQMFITHLNDTLQTSNMLLSVPWWSHHKYILSRPAAI